MRSTIGGCLIALLLLAAPARGQGGLEERWGAIRTDNFVLHYHEATEPLAEETAAMLEGAHTFVCDAFGWSPRGRTHVVLEDPTDSANGFANTVPWNAIRLHAVRPTELSALGYYDNWMWNLVVHEYVHVVHLSRVGGIPRVLNLLTNGELRPNQALPRWFTEGIATWFESEASGTGRIHHVLFDAYLHGAILDDTFPTVGALSGDPLEFPYATGWYLYGSRFMDYVIREHGLEAVTEFIDVYGRQVLPYRINELARRTIGDGFVDMWPAFRAETAGSAWAAHVTSRAVRAPNVESLTAGGHRSEHLALHPSGLPAWIRDDGHSKATLVVPGRVELPLESTGAFEFLDERTAVISLSHPVSAGYTFRDLFALNLIDGTLDALTWGERAAEPSVSPGGDRVAFSAPVDGRSELRLLSLASGEVQTVVEVSPWEQASSPAWLDEDTLVFSHFRPGRGRDLALVDLPTGEVSWLTADRARAVTPSVLDGVVYFSSDRGGLFDIYRINPADGLTERVTQTATAAFTPIATEHDGRTTVHYAEVSGHGYDIRSMTFDQALGPAGPAPATIREPMVFEAPSDTRRGGPPIRGARVPDLTLALGVSGETQALGFGLRTEDVGANSIALSFEYAQEFQQPVAAVDFTNRRLPVALWLSASRGLVRRDDRLRAGSEFHPYTEEQFQGAVGTSVPVRRIGSIHVFSVSYSANWFRFLDGLDVLHEPDDLQPITPDFVRFNAVRLAWSWRDADRDRHAFTRNRGSNAQIGFRFRSPVIGAEVESAELTASGARYAAIGRTVLAARLGGGVSESRGTARRQFAIGGLAPHDLFLSLRESTPSGSFHVRGHAPSARSGNRYVRGQLELRFPLVNLNAGAGTLPIFLERLHGAVFVDGGMAASRNLVVADGIYGVGGELRLATALGYTEAAAFRAGIARGFGEGGIWDAYALYGFEF